MKLEVDKTYETADGELVTIKRRVNDVFIGVYLIKENSLEDYHKGCPGAYFSVWKEDGMSVDNKDPQLVKEWIKEGPLVAWLTRSPSCPVWSIVFAPIKWAPTGSADCRRAEWLDEPIVTPHDPGEEHA